MTTPPVTCGICGRDTDILEGVMVSTGYDANGSQSLEPICAHCYLYEVASESLNQDNEYGVS